MLFLLLPLLRWVVAMAILLLVRHDDSHVAFSFQSPLCSTSIGAKSNNPRIIVIERPPFGGDISPWKLSSSSSSEAASAPSIATPTSEDDESKASSTKTKSKAELRWEKLFRLLQTYRDREGHVRVPQSHKEEGENLGTWLNTQRTKYRANTLVPDKIQLLEKLGVVWTLRDQKWNLMVELLRDYQTEHGHCKVPQNYKTKGEPLGKWLDWQRQLHKSNSLDKARQAQLESMGVVWKVHASNQQDMLASLARYQKRMGNSHVPVSFRDKDGRDLGGWLARQRRLHKAGNLDPQLIRELEDAGVVWSMHQQKWQTMFDLLDKFQQREGHCRVKQTHQENGKNLGTWLDRQRTKKKQGKLDAKLQAKLEDLGVEWEINGKFDRDDDDDDWGFEGLDHLFDDEEYMYD